jgi:hypothetical protein
MRTRLYEIAQSLIAWRLVSCHSRKLHPYGFARFSRISA